MKIGCYSIDLYCDAEIKHPFWWHFPKTYTGRSEAACIRAAVAEGWRVGRERQLCPVCSGRITVLEALKRHYGRDVAMSPDDRRYADEAALEGRRRTKRSAEG